MTESQRIITRLIESGASDRTIMQFSGKCKSYVQTIRRNLTEDPHYYKSINIKNAIRNEAERRVRVARRRSKERAGRVECLRCSQMFDSVDRRYNRICPRCSGSRVMQDSYAGEEQAAIRMRYQHVAVDVARKQIS